MFDRVVISPRPQSVTVHQTTIERRAPTDESARLLRDMETTARRNVIKAVRVGDTTFECVVHTMRDFVENDQLIKAVLSLNGKNVEVDVRAAADLDRNELVAKLVDAVSVRLAQEVVGPALRALLAPHR